MNQFGVALPYSPSQFSFMIPTKILPQSAHNIVSSMHALGLYHGSVSNVQPWLTESGSSFSMHLPLLGNQSV